MVKKATRTANGNGNGGRRRAAPRKPNGGGRRRVNGNRLVATAVSYAGAMSNQRPVVNGMHSMRGSDFFSTVEVQPNVSGTGRIIAKVPISPSQFPGTRLTQLADLWEFFKFTKFHLRWVPAVPTTLACQFVLYMDLDPTDDPTAIADEEALVRQAVAQTGAQQWNFHVPKTIPLAMRADRQYYFTGADKQNIRFTQQGAAYLIQITNPINFNGELISTPLQAGSLFIDWAINFSTPQINPAAVITNPTSVVDIENRITSTIIPDLSTGVTEYTVSGFTPRKFYAVSLNFTMSKTAPEGSLDLRGAPDSGISARILSSSGGISGNFVNTAALPGFLVRQANDVGDVEFTLDSTSLSSSNVAFLRIVYMPLYEELAPSAPPRITAVRHQSTTMKPKATDLGPCPICELDSAEGHEAPHEHLPE